MTVRFFVRWLLIPVRATAVAGFDVVKEIFVGLGVMAALLGGRAIAADLKASAPPPVPYSNWSGPYIGVGVDARYNAVDGNVTSATVGTPPTAIPLPTVSEGYTNPLMWWGAGPGAMQYIDNIAFGVRLYGGWNFQVAPTYVVGLEGDFAYANEAAVFHGSPYPANLLFGSPSLPFGASPNDEFKVRTTWDGSARVRAGWLATPSMMLYLTAGLAWAHLEVTSTCSTVPTPNVSNCAPGNYLSGTLGPAVIEHSATKLGWTVGAGIDMSLGGQWVARAQYRFSDFGYPSFGGFSPFSFTDTRSCSGCPSAASSPLTVSYDLPLMQHIFHFGVAYKFGQ
jgi:outer membrane immunogenic protein